MNNIVDDNIEIEIEILFLRIIKINWQNKLLSSNPST